MTAPSYGAAWPHYARQWDAMELRASRKAQLERVAARLTAPPAKARYQAVEAKTGVPWFMIAVIHEREASQNWRTHLHNGDSLAGYTHHVPAGRPRVGHGPPFTWEESAIDALRYDGLDKVRDWRLEKLAYHLEGYNGWGYRAHGVPSAYLWAGSTVYTRGKFVADGVWSPAAVDAQLGCMPLIKCMMARDQSIRIARESAAVDQPSVASPPLMPAAPARSRAPSTREAGIQNPKDDARGPGSPLSRGRAAETVPSQPAPPLSSARPSLIAAFQRLLNLFTRRRRA